MHALDPPEKYICLPSFSGQKQPCLERRGGRTAGVSACWLCVPGSTLGLTLGSVLGRPPRGGQGPLTRPGPLRTELHGSPATQRRALT